MLLRLLQECFECVGAVLGFHMRERDSMEFVLADLGIGKNMAGDAVKMGEEPAAGGDAIVFPGFFLRRGFCVECCQ